MRTRKLQTVCIIVVILELAWSASAQRSKGPAPAPIPPQIGTAKKIFISNAGGESFEMILQQAVFDGGPDRPYNQFYAAMKDWDRYELVSTPANADLAVEVSWDLTDTGLHLPVLGQRRLVIVEPEDARHVVDFGRACARRCAAGKP